MYLISVQENMTTVFFVENAVLYTLNMNYMQADEAESFYKRVYNKIKSDLIGWKYTH